MYSGLAFRRVQVDWDLKHIDINASFDVGDTMLELTEYNNEHFRIGDVYRLFIKPDTDFMGTIVEKNEHYEHSFEVRFFVSADYEFVIDWEPRSDNCVLQLANRTENLEVSLSLDWTIHQRSYLIDNPIDALYYVRRSQNWDEFDENGEPIRHINIDPSSPGSFFNSSLELLRQVKICRQILNYNDATTKAISKSICEEFGLILYTDNKGNESVKMIDNPESDISFTITVHDIIKEPEIIERDPNKIYCEPKVKFAIDWSTNNPTKQFSITNTAADEYEPEYTPGLYVGHGELLWTMAKTLRRAVNIVTPYEFTFKWIFRNEDAVQLLTRRFIWMSKKRMKLVLSYDKGIDLTVGSWGKVVIPISTVGKEIRFIIEEISKSKKRGKNSSLVSMQVVLWDNVTSEELEILQNQAYDILGATIQLDSNAADSYQDIPE